jgi:hypothetical protein
MFKSQEGDVAERRSCGSCGSAEGERGCGGKCGQVGERRASQQGLGKAGRNGSPVLFVRKDRDGKLQERAERKWRL